MPALSTVVSKVRHTLQDEDSVAYRTEDTKMVEFANDFVRELALLRPDLFATTGEINCTAGTVTQTAPTGSLVLMDIFQVKDGQSVLEGFRADMDRFNRGWRNDAAAVAENWMRDEKNPNQFFIYPKAPSGQVLIGQWAALPAEMTAVGDQIPAQVPESYYTAMHHYMVFRSESKDDEAVLQGRAKLFYDGFASLTGAGKGAKREAEIREGSQNAQQQVAQ